MSDREDFLSRWSRRKRDAEKESAKPEDEVPAADPAEQAPVVEAETAREFGAKPDGEEKEEPAFDLSSLPSIETITAETDIRPFLAAGVPAGLRQAALRRAWSADPAIRDFIGIAENQWDFTPGGNAPGFDFSTPSEEMRRAVVQMFTGTSSDEKQRPRGESGFDLEPEPLEPEPLEPDPLEQVPVVESAPEPDQIAVSSENVDRDAASGPTPLREPLPVSSVPERDVASQNDDAPQDEKPKLVAHRSHGGAMPK
jgi:hypothetical protein